MSAVKVIYSIGVRFAAGGIGDIAYHGVCGLYRQKMLHRLLCGSYREAGIPEQYVRQFGLLSRVLRRGAVYERRRSRLLNLHNRLYDHWLASQLEPCDVFLNWNGFGLRALRQARRAGSLTAVYRASSHPREQARLLSEERARWSLPQAPPDPAVEQAIAELEEADLIIIPSTFVRDTCLKHGLPSAKLIEIPFGVDAARFRPPKQPAGEAPFRVLFLGQVGWRKGVPYLLQAWERLGWRDAELWIAGRVQPGFDAWLRPFRGLPGLRLMGHVNDPAEILRQCHMFVFPTIEEGSALVVYEAMASGLPVVTTANAGSPIRDQNDGILIPIRDVDQLAKQMAALRADSGRRRVLGMEARRRIEAYSWRRYGDTLASSLTSAYRKDRMTEE